MIAEDPIVIVAAARTPLGRFLGGLAPVAAADLGAVAIRAAPVSYTHLTLPTKA